MDCNNPYNLCSRRIKGPNRCILLNTYTEEDQAKRLVGCEKIPRERWEEISPGTHISYIRKTGEFRVGGIITLNTVGAQREPDEDNRIFRIQSGAAGWFVPYKDIEYLYAGRDITNTIFSEELKKALTVLNDKINKLTLHCKKQDERIKELELALARR